MQAWASSGPRYRQTRGASFADARVMDIRLRDISTKNGEVGTLAETESLGIGIRVIANGCWGFASTDQLTREGVQACAAQAVAIAQASALAKRDDARMAPEEAYVDTWQNPFSKIRSRFPSSARSILLLAADKEMRRVKGVTARGRLDVVPPHRAAVRFQLGSSIHQVKMQSGAGIVATSFAGSEIQKRSYPNSFGGQHMLARLRAGRIARSGRQRAAHRRRGRRAAFRRAVPEGQHTIILGGSQLGLQIHESIGHPIELDRVLGMEANFAGMSFLTVEKLRKLKYGSDIVNVVADARLEHGPGLGTFAYDDEGVPAQCTPHHHRRPLHRLSQQSRNGLGHRLKRAPAAPCARESWNRLPMIRMTNISINPGTWKYDDLIADTDDAILMETNRSWSIDDRRYHFQFSTEIGWEIKGGKKGRMIKNPSYSGITTEFWNSCDAICSRDHWTLWGTPNCGKGPAHANNGHRPRRLARALPQHQSRSRPSRNNRRSMPTPQTQKSQSARQAATASRRERLPSSANCVDSPNASSN